MERTHSPYQKNLPLRVRWLLDLSRMTEKIIEKPSGLSLSGICFFISHYIPFTLFLFFWQQRQKKEIKIYIRIYYRAVFFQKNLSILVAGNSSVVARPAKKKKILYQKSCFYRAKDGFIFVEFGRAIADYPTGWGWKWGRGNSILYQQSGTEIQKNVSLRSLGDCVNWR